MQHAHPRHRPTVVFKEASMLYGRTENHRTPDNATTKIAVGYRCYVGVESVGDRVRVELAEFASPRRQAAC